MIASPNALPAHYSGIINLPHTAVAPNAGPDKACMQVL